MEPKLTEIASGLESPEGPIYLADGSLIIVEIAAGCVSRIAPDSRKQIVAKPGVVNLVEPHGGRYLDGPPGFTSFDSLAVEANGNICVASLVLGGINVIASDGRFIEFLAMPDPHCTNICFGGPDLRTAYVTLSGSGRLVSLPWPRAGLRLNY